MNQGLLEPWPGQVRLGAAGGCAEVAVMKDTGARRRTPAGGHSPHSPDLSVGTVTHRATASAPCRTRSTQRRTPFQSNQTGFYLQIILSNFFIFFSS